MPFDPDKLQSILWHDDIGYGIGAAINVKGCFRRIFRVYLGKIEQLIDLSDLLIFE